MDLYPELKLLGQRNKSPQHLLSRRKHSRQRGGARSVQQRLVYLYARGVEALEHDAAAARRKSMRTTRGPGFAIKMACVSLSLSLLGLPSSTAREAELCGRGFEKYKEFKIGGEFIAVDSAGPDDVWAVGDRWRRPTLIAHYDGQSWERADAPAPRRGAYLLSDVDARTRRDVWAVGVHSRGNRFLPLALHYDGRRWSKVPVARIGRDTFLNGVAVRSKRKVVVVGGYETSRREGTLALRFDGRRWRRQWTPSPRRSSLAAVDVHPRGGYWAVGRRGAEGHALVLRRREGRWRRKSLPRRARRADLEAISVAPNGSMWTGGARGNRAVVLRRHHGDWRVFTPPDRRGHEHVFGLHAPRARNVWGVGWRFVPEVPHTYAAHWKGGRWKVVPSEDVGGSSVLNDVVATGAGTAWAVGVVAGKEHPLVERAC